MMRKVDWEPEKFSLKVSNEKFKDWLIEIKAYNLFERKDFLDS